MSCHSNRHRHYHHHCGFTLIETLAWMTLLGIFMLMGSQAFMQTKNLMVHTHRNAQQISQMEGMVRLLRRDVWPSQSITTKKDVEHGETDDAQQAPVAIGDGIVLKMGETGEHEIVWTWGRYSPMVRRVETRAGQVISDLQWKNAGDNWLVAGPSSVTLKMQPAVDNQPPRRIEMVSQMLLLKEMQ